LLVIQKNQRLDIDNNNGVISTVTTTNNTNNTNNGLSRCVDLIVLGINYRSNEEDVRTYFSQFGELVFCEIKRDAHGQSRGFGFVRYKDYESQLNALTKRHHIDGRNIDLKIPDSKNPLQEPECARKVFVARLPDIVTADDLNRYFKRYGVVTDVYIPKPSRSFAFVSFLDSAIVPNLYGDHFINGCSVHVGPAEPKGKPNENQFKRSKPDRPPHNIRSVPQSNAYSQYGNNNLGTGSGGGGPVNNELFQQMFNPSVMQAFLQQFAAQGQQQQQQAGPKYDTNWAGDPTAYGRHMPSKYGQDFNESWNHSYR